MTDHTRRRTRSARRERGETLVEFAFTSVVFFMIIFGTLWFGLAVWWYNLVASLAQEGARSASVRGSTASTHADTSSLTDYLNTRALGINLSQVTLSCGATSASLAACDCTSSTATTCVAGNLVQVGVETMFAPGTALIPSAQLVLGAKAQMLIAR